MTPKPKKRNHNARHESTPNAKRQRQNANIYQNMLQQIYNSPASLDDFAVKLQANPRLLAAPMATRLLRDVSNMYVLDGDSGSQKLLHVLIKQGIASPSVNFMSIDSLLTPHGRMTRERSARLFQVVRVMLKHGADINEVHKDWLYETTLLHTIMRGSTMHNIKTDPDDVIALLRLGSAFDRPVMAMVTRGASPVKQTPFEIYVTSHVTMDPRILRLARRRGIKLTSPGLSSRISSSAWHTLQSYKLVNKNLWNASKTAKTSLRKNPVGLLQNEKSNGMNHTVQKNVAFMRRRLVGGQQPPPLGGLYREYMNGYSQRVNAAVARYFIHKALRAPQQPSARGSNPQTRIQKLYRAMHIPSRDVKHGYTKDAAFMSFTTSRDVALDHHSVSSTSAVVTVNVSSIPPGTPWVWYKPDTHANNPHDYVPSSTKFAQEQEVLLPPGTLTFQTVSRRQGIYYIQAAYAPNEFAVRAPPVRPHPSYRPKPFAGPLVRRSIPSNVPIYVQNMYRTLFNATK